MCESDGFWLASFEVITAEIAGNILLFLCKMTSAPDLVSWPWPLFLSFNQKMASGIGGRAAIHYMHLETAESRVHAYRPARAVR